MSGYWQVSISIISDEALNYYQEPQIVDSDKDESAEPFGDNEDIRDIIATILFDNFPCEGVVVEEETFKEFKRTGKAEDIRAFFTSSPDVGLIKSTILENIAQDLNLNIEATPIEDKDWSIEWKKNWRPTKISDKIVICPTWLEYEPSDNEIVINLDPGMAFGTGTHATTQLCVKAMEKHMQPNSELADIGCGSGILAICGVKLGAKSAIAVDNDGQVIPVAIDNATLNNVEDKIKFFEATSANLLGKTYDFICANILHNVLNDIMNELKQLLSQNGKMVLSGILDEKEHIVIKAIEREGLNIVEKLTQQNWVAFVVNLKE